MRNAGHRDANLFTRTIFIELNKTLKRSRMPEQAKKWWTNKLTNQTLYPCCACAHGVININIKPANHGSVLLRLVAVSAWTTKF